MRQNKCCTTNEYWKCRHQQNIRYNDERGLGIFDTHSKYWMQAEQSKPARDNKFV